MVKFISRALLALGAMVLVVGMVAQFWATQKVEQVPLNTNSTTRLSGHAEVIDGTTGKLQSTDVRATNLTRVDSRKSDRTNVVWTSVTCLVKAVPGPDCGSPGTGVNADPNVINIGASAFVTNRHTGFAVNPARYLAANETSPMSGLANKFPFDTAKKTYPMWNDLLQKPIDAVYSGTQNMNGLTTYVFKSSVEHEAATVSDGIQGFYTTEITYNVEPVTGAIINQVQHELRTTTAGATLLDINLAFTADQVAKNVSDAKSNVSRLTLITSTLPMVGWSLGLPMLLIGAGLLVLRLRRDRSAVTTEEKDAPKTAAHV